jgi:hypothetical protein
MIRKNRIHRDVRGGWNILAVRNTGGYFVATTRNASRHSKVRLILRLPNMPEIVLDGRQIKTLEHLLHELRPLRQRTNPATDYTEEEIVAGKGWRHLVQRPAEEAVPPAGPGEAREEAGAVAGEEGSGQEAQDQDRPRRVRRGAAPAAVAGAAVQEQDGDGRDQPGQADV